MGKVIQNQNITQLPLNARNFLRLASLMPGTTSGAPSDGTRRDRQEGISLTVNGQRSEYNNYRLDGIDNNGQIAGVAVMIPSIDAIQEFKVQTAASSAEYGRTSGGVVNIVIKSGTNEFHGTAFEFLRNDVLDATDFFTNFFGEKKTPLRRNQFGASIGGPVIKNKTFFFGNYEGFRERRGRTRSFTAPTAPMRAGDFSALAPVHDPFDLDDTGNRPPFPGNVIPPSRIHPASAKIVDAVLWPLPNNPADPVRNYVRNFNDPLDRNQFHIRGDHKLTARDDLMGRVSWQKSEDLTDKIALDGQFTNFIRAGTVLGWTRTFTPQIINEFRFGFNRYSFYKLHQDRNTDYASRYGLPSASLGEDTLGHPVISIRNIAHVGGAATAPLFRTERNFDFLEKLSVVKGRHSLKVGAEVRYHRSWNNAPRFGRGNYTFKGPFTGPIGKQYPNGFADFLLGLPTKQQLLDASFFQPVGLRNTRVMLFVNDDVRVLPSLTLNVGLRWEGDLGTTRTNYQFAYFDFVAGELVYPKKVKIPFDLPYPHRFEDLERMNHRTLSAFAPRVGFAWRPLSDNNTVVRSSYGVFWTNPLEFILQQAIPPFLLTQIMTSGTTEPELTFGVFPSVETGSLVAVRQSFQTFTPDVGPGYVQQWTFGIERQLGADVALKVSYVGSKGTHLERRWEANAALPPGPGPINDRRRYPKFGPIIRAASNSYSTYHGLQISVERRLAHGLWFLGGYSWSKSLDDTSSWNPQGGQASQYPQDPRRLFLEKGRSNFDLRHRFVFSGHYDLPFRVTSRIGNTIVQGWQIAGLLELRTGFPFTPIVGGDIPNAGTRHTRPDIVGEPALDPSDRTIDRWFNTEAFAPPGPYTFGNAGRNILDGPGAQALDFSVMRVFRIGEGHRLQFRAEFFNFLNHPSFGLPVRAVDNKGFGTIRSGGAGREVQLGLKYIF